MTRKNSVSWPASVDFIFRGGIDVLLLTALRSPWRGARSLCQVQLRWSTSFALRCIICSLNILILGKWTSLKLSLISIQPWKWALFALFSNISLRFLRRPCFSWLVLLLLGTFLLFRLLLLLLLRFQHWLLEEWCPYICDLYLVVGSFLLNLQNMIREPLELGLFLDSWVSLSDLTLSLLGELGGAPQWVSLSMFAGERTHWCRKVEMFRASWWCFISHLQFVIGKGRSLLAHFPQNPRNVCPLLMTSCKKAKLEIIFFGHICDVPTKLEIVNLLIELIQNEDAKALVTLVFWELATRNAWNQLRTCRNVIDWIHLI